jgi:hypothetical protein
MTTTPNARVAPRPTLSPYDLPRDAVDLAYSASLPEFAGQPGRIMDVAKSIDVALDAVTQAMCEVVNQEMGSQQARVDAAIAGLVHRMELIERDTQGLRREVALLTRCLDRDRTAHKAAAKRKPKANGKPDASLPDFILKPTVPPAPASER